MPDPQPEAVKTVTEANINQVVYLIKELGVPIVMCGFLAYMLHVKIEKLGYKIDRCIRNERAIMQKLEIPIIVKNDEWEK